MYTHRSTRCRLLPETRSKHQKLMQLTGACIWVWNRMLAQNEQDYWYHERLPWLVDPPSTTFFSLGRQFTKLRGRTDWLRELPFSPVRHVLKHQADAWQRYFKGQGGRPQFKSKYQDRSVFRDDWHHHVSKDIASKASSVFIEDLKTRNMTRSARGSADNPGSNVKAKSGLNRSILETGWAGLGHKLGYKARDLGKVNPRNTSITCHPCGHVDSNNRKTQAVFKCLACGHAANADTNAALNILALKDWRDWTWRWRGCPACEASRNSNGCLIG